jgi:hypothetical protein
MSCISVASPISSNLSSRYTPHESHGLLSLLHRRLNKPYHFRCMNDASFSTSMILFFIDWVLASELLRPLSEAFVFHSLGCVIPHRIICHRLHRGRRFGCKSGLPRALSIPPSQHGLANAILWTPQTKAIGHAISAFRWHRPAPTCGRQLADRMR